jgi:hypothetical protein
MAADNLSMGIENFSSQNAAIEQADIGRTRFQIKQFLLDEERVGSVPVQ